MFLLAVVGGWPVMPVQAETLRDPTQPPPGFVDTADLRGGAFGGAGVQIIDSAPVKPKGPELQSVLLPKQGTPVAIISGQYVPLGGRFGGLRLVSITEQRVVLVSGKLRRVLKLTPQAEKTKVTITTKTAPVSDIRVKHGEPAKNRGREQ